MQHFQWYYNNSKVKKGKFTRLGGSSVNLKNERTEFIGSAKLYNSAPCKRVNLSED